MPNSVRGFLQPYLHLWHLLISWRLQVLSSRRLRRLLQTIADYNAIFDSDFFASIRDIVGGRSGSYEEVLRQAKDTALREMQDQAALLGAVYLCHDLGPRNVRAIYL